MYTCLEVSEITDTDFSEMFQESLSSLEGGNFPFKDGLTDSEKESFFRSRFKEAERTLWAVVEDSTGDLVAYYSGKDDGTNFKVYTGVYRSGYGVDLDFAHAQCDFFKSRGYQTIEAYCVEGSTSAASMITGFGLDCYEFVSDEPGARHGDIHERKITLRVL